MPRKPEENFPHIDLPPLWVKSHVIKLLYPESRWYVEYGSCISFAHWCQEVNVHLGPIGGFLPLQYVDDFVGVSRAAVLLRAKRGGLTVFSFIFTDYKKNILGRILRKETRKRIDIVPLSECNAWHQILLDMLPDDSWIDRPGLDRAERRLMSDGDTSETDLEEDEEYDEDNM